MELWVSNVTFISFFKKLILLPPSIMTETTVALTSDPNLADSWHTELTYAFVPSAEDAALINLYLLPI